ncbi:hypothetical protein RvY_02214 [Ramazzottius varieornatus]|uniref:Pre-mRNA processing factor 4 (PRP4)-like domain-containing protein n=1 Tax=Ramazzottius varieornatus TaxID=947166 RepID=A0A1D1UQZ0_RAMVA|nr:hypothetical protein RvY_02214 [Ramazzottius varieornatus]
MSDEEDDFDHRPSFGAPRQDVLHFGTLDMAGANGKEAVVEDEPMEDGGKPADSVDLDQVPNTALEKYMAESELKKKAKLIHVPTDDAEINQMFRSVGEPICLHGEQKLDRIERLKKLLAVIGDIRQYQQQKEEEKSRKELDKQTWYHTGPDSLAAARVFIATYSLPRAKVRLERARETAKLPASQQMATIQEGQKKLRNFTNYSSQVGDNRPLSYCSFSPNSQLLATASWSGLCKLWSIPESNLLRTFRGHSNVMASAIVFHPFSTIGQSEDSLNLASCAVDGGVKFWNLNSDEPIGGLDSHKPHRVSRLAFHPSGRFLGSCCFDQSWRLYDLQAEEEVLFQEGHSKEVYCIAFQPDGSLAVTGGFDSYGRVWDLRTGRCVMFMEGHLKSILSVDCASNGYHIATASEDHTCMIWDLRQRGCIYKLPAHNQLVSSVHFEPNNGQHLVTASYDKTIKLWSSPHWSPPLKTLTGHDNKVMCACISPDQKYIASASYDRTFKLWAPE